MKGRLLKLPDEFGRVSRVTGWSILAAATSFFAGIVTARTLGPEGRGLVALSVSVAGLGSVLGAAGTNVALRVLLPKNDAEVNLKGYARVSVQLAMMLALPVLVGSVFLVAFGIDERFFSWTWGSLFLVFGLSNFVWLQSKEALNAVGRVVYSAGVNAVGSIVFLAMIGVYAIVRPGNFHLVMLCYCLMNACQAVMSVRVLRRDIDLGPALGRRKLLVSGPPYLAYHFGQDLALKMDRPLVGAFSSASQLGQYSVGAGLAEVMRLPILASGQFVLNDAARGGLGARGIIKHAFIWTAVVLPVSGVIWLLAPQAILLVYGDSFLGAVTPFRFLVLGQVCLVPFLIASRGLVGIGGRWLASVPGLVGVLCIGIAGPLLIDRLAATGGAVACLIGFFGMSLSAIFLLKNIRSQG